MKKNEYRDTLNLPKTNFNMKANLAQNELKYLKFWQENNIYEKSNENKGKEFILHDGPPYANGDIHIGQTLNKILKDIILKYKRLNDYNAPYVPGWDTHGLPIELKVNEIIKESEENFDDIKIRNKCRNYALKFVEKQKKSFIRLGVFGEWANPYITLNSHYEAKQIEVFAKLYENNYIFKGLKPIHWCPECGTALAEAEIEYYDHKSPSIYVKFELIDNIKEKFDLDIDNLNLVIWTTTPWTLPGNVAIAVNKEFEYVIISTKKSNLLLAKDLLETALNEMDIIDYKILKSGIKGSGLEYLKCKHPFLDRESLVIIGDHVTLEAGTGCVHTAPGHGQEDYVVSLKYNLEIISPVDSKGHLTKEAGIFNGLFYKKANKLIIEKLKQSEHLLNTIEISHSYPHCWRCKKPVIFRATDQWFVKVQNSDLREKALKALEEVKFVPEWGRNRITSMVENRPDWCISRQRIWGVPIPIFYCKDCEKVIFNQEIAKKVIEKIKKFGSNIWLKSTPKELIEELAFCDSCKCQDLIKETNIMDVWFDSGISHKAVLENRENLKWPADVYLEGSDQHRGWFQTSLLTSVGTKGKAPYKTLITHGFVNDGNGKKMSKSLGNVIKPEEIIQKNGADIMRLWCASVDYREDLKISDIILNQVIESYRKIRNTARYILGNIYDFDVNNDIIEYSNLENIDKYILHKLELLKRKTKEYYDNYELYNIINEIQHFVTLDLSAFYFDIIKDRLYVLEKNDRMRRSSQTVLTNIIEVLVKILSPILSFTAEEIWENLPSQLKNCDSVLLSEWPSLNDNYLNYDLSKEWEKIIELRSFVNKELELKRQEKVIGHPLDAQIIIKYSATSQFKDILIKYKKDLEDVFIVSKVILEEAEINDISINVIKSIGTKCDRCWKYEEELTNGICSKCSEVVS